MNALIVLAHGSRREKSNQEVIDLVDSIRPRLGARFDRIDAAFLEIVPPSLQDSIEDVLEQGARSVTIFPYFLNSGNHVDRDIPAIVDHFQERYPDRAFIVTHHFGNTDDVGGLIVEQLLSAS